MEFYNLKIQSDYIKETFAGDKIQINIEMSRHFHDAKEMAKVGRCLICNKIITSTCNSHSIPQFCLRNIAENGEVLTCNSAVDFSFYFKKKSGIKNAGTFNLICHECDSKVFQDYENPLGYDNFPNSKILAEIALKNYLKIISKRNEEIALYNNLIQEHPGVEHIKHDVKIKKLDLEEAKNGLKAAQKTLAKNYNESYKILYFKKLDYVVPIAFQGAIALYTDLESKIINYIYNENANYKIKLLHICIFPLESATIILLFVDYDNNRYKSFKKQFLRLSENAKLSIINYIIFLYSEDFFASKKLESEFQHNEKLNLTIGQTSNMIINYDELYSFNPYSELIRIFNLNNHATIPNFLDSTYKLNSI